MERGGRLPRPLIQKFASVLGVLAVVAKRDDYLSSPDPLKFQDRGSTTTSASRVRNPPVGCEVVQSAVVVAHDKLLGFSVCPSPGRARVTEVSALQKGSYQALVVVLPTGEQAHKTQSS